MMTGDNYLGNSWTIYGLISLPLWLGKMGEALRGTIRTQPNHILQPDYQRQLPSHHRVLGPLPPPLGCGGLRDGAEQDPKRGGCSTSDSENGLLNGDALRTLLQLMVAVMAIPAVVAVTITVGPGVMGAIGCVAIASVPGTGLRVAISLAATTATTTCGPGNPG